MAEEADVSCSEFSVEEFSDYLKISKFPANVVDSFLANKISGSIFLLLEEEELKDLVPITGYRIKVRELLRSQKLRHVSEYIHGKTIVYIILNVEK